VDSQPQFSEVEIKNIHNFFQSVEGKKIIDLFNFNSRKVAYGRANDPDHASFINGYVGGCLNTFKILQDLGIEDDEPVKKAFDSGLLNVE